MHQTVFNKAPAGILFFGRGIDADSAVDFCSNTASCAVCRIPNSRNGCIKYLLLYLVSRHIRDAEIVKQGCVGTESLGIGYIIRIEVELFIGRIFRYHFHKLLKRFLIKMTDTVFPVYIGLEIICQKGIEHRGSCRIREKLCIRISVAESLHIRHGPAGCFADILCFAHQRIDGEIGWNAVQHTGGLNGIYNALHKITLV